ncbi:MAG: thioredoxin family protein [Saprospiraceae bacterium]|nr:MAG: thioredoxin [Bacteroidetes bacterium OLB9]MCO6463658.1 thioredoxin family protein [Saprospiraceae bacterium]MCZ2338943.1 thioredoxin family protein [Chitinophagales bacterium]
MNWNSYIEDFDAILSTENPEPPYDNPEYLEFTKLNSARLKRWIKTAQIQETTIATIEAIQQPQNWIVITEHWCGDAAHIVPILYKMSTLNEKIKFSIQLRDSDSEIDKYLTNGSKSIPILVVRDQEGKDWFHWGPRPKAAQDMFIDLKNKNTSFEESIEVLQNYYNKDKSLSIQQEVTALLKQTL